MDIGSATWVSINNISQNTYKVPRLMRVGRAGFKQEELGLEVWQSEVSILL